MEMLWYRIAVGQVVEEHPRYEIHRVYEGLNPLYLELPADVEQKSVRTNRQSLLPFYSGWHLSGIAALCLDMLRFCLG